VHTHDRAAYEMKKPGLLPAFRLFDRAGSASMHPFESDRFASKVADMVISQPDPVSRKQDQQRKRK
jgi:hypothetical protein